jgi:hypothetical protein
MNQHLILKASPGIIRPRRRHSDRPGRPYLILLLASPFICPPFFVGLVWVIPRALAWVGRHWTW